MNVLHFFKHISIGLFGRVELILQDLLPVAEVSQVGDLTFQLHGHVPFRGGRWLGDLLYQGLDCGWKLGKVFLEDIREIWLRIRFLGLDSQLFQLLLKL